MHTCSSIVITCIDFRIQPFVEDWAKERFGGKNYDRVAWAGGVKDFSSILKQIDLSVKLHNINKVILMNHEDCGAYGELGTEEKHCRDLLVVASAVKSKYPNLTVETYYMKLDGAITTV